MTIKLTGDEFYEQFQEAQVEQLGWDSSDKLDFIYQYDARIIQGCRRIVQLRDGIEIQIWKSRPRDRLLINYSELKNHINVWFSLAGNVQEIYSSTAEEIILPYRSGKYLLYGSGLKRPNICNCSDAGTNFELGILIRPDILRSFTASSDGELPKNLQHLVLPSSQAQYMRSGNTTPMMSAVVQEILHCSHQGLIKRAFLESKAIELMALVLDQEVAIQQGEVKKVSLKPEQIERIHYAKEILLRDLSNPPSLSELAHQVGLNDYLLRKGFHQVFGTTVFGELQAYRLDFAKQLLAEQKISMSEISRLLGYANRNSFSRAFKHKFGFSPIDYRKSCR
ncbi:MAG: AraC family transcriptional regulator [Cyanobacteria bacterium P01_G01_bin.19]